MPLFQKTYQVTVLVDTTQKIAWSEIKEKGGKLYTIEYEGDGLDYHGVLQNSSLLTNVDSWRDALQHVLKYSSKVIFTRFHDFTRDIYFKSKVDGVA